MRAMVEAGDTPHGFEVGDEFRVDQEPLSGRTYEVTDVEEQDIGLGTIVAVGAVSGSETYSLTWVVGNEVLAFSPTHSDVEYDVLLGSIVVQNT